LRNKTPIISYGIAFRNLVLWTAAMKRPSTEKRNFSAGKVQGNSCMKLDMPQDCGSRQRILPLRESRRGFVGWL